MSPRSFVAPRCAWPKPAPSIALSGRPTALASAQSKSLAGNRSPIGPSEPQKPASAAINNGHQNGHARLRDRLCLLIRQHQLDANLVKAYAADFCGTPNLRDATREQIETFIANLSDWATKDRPALLCKLNSYSRPQEVDLMKRHIPGLHRENRNGSDELEGVFLVRVDRAFYRWHPTRPFYLLRFSVLEPKEQLRPFPYWPDLLHTQSAVAAELVPARFRL